MNTTTSNTLVTLQGFIIVPNGDLDAVQTELPHHISLTQEEAGCLVFSVQQRPEALNQFDVYEQFEDQDAFEVHQARVTASTWGQVTQNVERHYKVTGLRENS